MRYGSVYDRHNHVTKIMIYIGKEEVYLMSFAEQDCNLIEPCLDELRGLQIVNEDSLAQVKDKYKALKTARPGPHPRQRRVIVHQVEPVQPAPEPVQPVQPVSACPDTELFDLLRRALSARHTLQEAARDYIEAKDDDDLAWKSYEERLASFRSNGHEHIEIERIDTNV